MRACFPCHLSMKNQHVAKCTSLLLGNIWKWSHVKMHFTSITYQRMQEGNTSCCICLSIFVQTMTPEDFDLETSFIACIHHIEATLKYQGRSSQVEGRRNYLVMLYPLIIWHINEDLRSLRNQGQSQRQSLYTVLSFVATYGEWGVCTLWQFCIIVAWKGWRCT